MYKRGGALPESPTLGILVFKDVFHTLGRKLFKVSWILRILK